MLIPGVYVVPKALARKRRRMFDRPRKMCMCRAVVVVYPWGSFFSLGLRVSLRPSLGLYGSVASVRRRETISWCRTCFSQGFCRGRSRGVTQNVGSPERICENAFPWLCAPCSGVLNLRCVRLRGLVGIGA